MSDELWTASEVGEFLRVSSSIVYRWVDAGLLPAFKLADGRGPLRFWRSEVEAWLEGRRVGAAQ